MQNSILDSSFATQYFALARSLLYSVHSRAVLIASTLIRLCSNFDHSFLDCVLIILPAPNGIKACGFSVRSPSAVRNRSGMNLSGSSQCFGL